MTGLSGRISHILLCFSVLTLPLTIFAAVLAYLVFHHRVRQNASDGQLASYTETDPPGVIYVDFSATYLLWFASWSSNLPPFLAGFVVTLAAYPVAKVIATESREQHPKKLLTPYQFFLALAMIDGTGGVALYRWIKYLVTWRHRRERQAPYFVGLGVALTVTTILGLLVAIADTWLHISSESVIHSLVTPASSLENYKYSNYLNSTCLGTNNTFAAQDVQAAHEYQYCSVGSSATHTWLPNADIVLPILYNVSGMRSINSVSSNQTFAYLGIPTDGLEQSVDFVATTYSVATQCKPVGKECNLNQPSGVAITFDCPMYPLFSGYVRTPPEMYFFTDATGSDNDTYAAGVGNPYYFGIAGIANYFAYDLKNLQDDPEILLPERGGVAFVIFCNSTVYDTTYTVVNGTVVHFKISQSNDSVANMVQVAVTGTGLEQYAQPLINERANLASLASTAQDLSDQLAAFYSRVSLALSSGALVQRPVQEIRERHTVIVTKIRTAPLFLQIVSNLLLAILGIILTIIALIASRDKAAREVQARLSLQNLVAEHFEGERARQLVEDLDDIFEEKRGQGSAKVGVVKGPSQGWTFAVWPKLAGLA